MDKTVATLSDAVSEIGGSVASATPIELIHALIDRWPKNPTVVNNNFSNGRIGIYSMIEASIFESFQPITVPSYTSTAQSSTSS